MTTTYGEVSWDDKNAGYNNNSGGDRGNKDIWFRLKEGSNPVRIVTRPQQYVVHSGIKRTGDKGYGQKVKCSKSNGSCPLCDMGYETSLRWFLGVIDRDTNTYKVLDIGPSIFFDIKTLNDGRWGDPTKYDLDIIRNPKSRDPKHFYSVQPIEKAPLSAADQKLLDEQMDMEFLQAQITPYTTDKVQQRLDKILEGGGTLVAPVKREKKSADKSAASKSVATKSVSDDEKALDDIFKSYDTGTDDA